MFKADKPFEEMLQYPLGMCTLDYTLSIQVILSSKQMTQVNTNQRRKQTEMQPELQVLNNLKKQALIHISC